MLYLLHHGDQRRISSPLVRDGSHNLIATVSRYLYLIYWYYIHHNAIILLYCSIFVCYMFIVFFCSIQLLLHAHIKYIYMCIYAHIVFYCHILLYIAIWYWHHGHSMALCLSHFVCVAALPLAGPFFAVLVSNQRIISLMGSYWSSTRSRGGSVRSSFRPSESTLKRESTLFYPQLWVNN